MPKGKPVELILVEGKSKHVTKAEAERRRAAEIKLGDKYCRMPSVVARRPEAVKKWKWLASLYKEFSFVNETDVAILARYCLTYADWLDVVERRVEAVALLGQEFSIEKLHGFDTIARIDNQLIKLGGLMNQIEDRLFLSPRSRVQSIPKKPEEKQDPLKAAGFGNV